MSTRCLSKYLSKLFYHSPRWLAAFWFGFWGGMGAGVMYFVPALDQGFISLLLYVFLPVIAASIAGYISGPYILATGTSIKAFGLGLLIVIEAFLFFAPLFSIAYALTTSGGVTNILGVTLSVLTLGFLITAPIILPVGGFSSLLLYYLYRNIEKDSESLPDSTES